MGRWLLTAFALVWLLWVVGKMVGDEVRAHGGIPSSWPSPQQLLGPSGLLVLDGALANRFPLRDEILQLRSSLYRSISGQTGIARVAAGRDGWLFITEGGTYDWYVGGAASPSPATAMAVARVIEERVARMQSLVPAYRLVLVPDKHAVYPEKLSIPWGQPPRGYSWVQEVYDLLKPATRRWVIHMLPLLQQARKQDARLLYYATDSHWTYWGAYLALDALSGLGLPAVPTPATTLTDLPTDLPRLAGLAPEEVSEKVVSFTSIYPECRPAGRLPSHNPPPEQVDVLLLIDSFGESICDWIRAGNVAAWADYYRWMGGAQGSLPQLTPRLALIEQVTERGLLVWAGIAP